MGSWGDSIIRVTPNGHLHAAILVALLVCLALVLVVPISRTAVGSNGGTLRLTPAGLANALGVPAGPLTQALAGTALKGGTHDSYSERVAPLLAINLIPQPLLGLTGEIVGESLPESALFAGDYSTFSVRQDGVTTSYSSAMPTVGEALADAGVVLGPGDIVYPGPDARLTPGLHVFVDYATAVTLIVAGEEQTVYTHASTVGELLEEQGIEVLATDILSARPSLALRDGLTLKVTTVRESAEFMEEPIPFRTVYTYDPSLAIGAEELRQAGKPGHLIREYLVTTIDGKEATEIVSETLTLPVDRVVAIGTQVPTAGEQPLFAIAAGEEIVCGGGILKVWATWYSASTSGGSGITRTGTGVYKGIIAVDPKVIPLGTHMYVPGYGFGIAADTGGGIKGNKIDLGYAEGDVKDWHTGYAEICVIG